MELSREGNEEMPKDDRFKLCPFCGNSDIRSDSWPDSKSTTGKIFTMCCYQCGARVASRASIEPMIEIWNKRKKFTYLFSPQAIS